MRNLMITVLLTTISLLANAQSFNEKTFADMMLRFEKDPVKYLQTETVADFVFVGTSGYVFDLKGVIGLYEVRTPVSRVMSDVKIRQYDNTAIVLGTQKHSYTSKKDGTLTTFNEQFTYIFIYQEGKWLNAGGPHGQTPIEQK